MLEALPKSVQPTAKNVLAEIHDAEDRDHAVAAAKRFDTEFSARRPKAADKLRDHLERLLTFYDFPAEHGCTSSLQPDRVDVLDRAAPHQSPPRAWAHEPPGWPWRSSSSSRPRTAGEQSTGPHLVALVRAGAIFNKGVLIENKPAEDQVAAYQRARHNS